MQELSNEQKKILAERIAKIDAGESTFENAMNVANRIKNMLDIRSELEKIWANKEGTEYPYLFNENIESKDLLFIGLNPSYNEQHGNTNSYRLKPNGNDGSYFRKIETIADLCEMTWNHIDLLYIRETNQKKVMDLCYNKEKGTDFIYKQLLLSKKIIELFSPKIIVVCNSFAATLLGKNKEGNKDVWLGYDFNFDDNWGTHKLNNTPIFFTSMLSGQRALDNGSKERLIWHIKRVKLITEEN